jgi:hypothetical protein
MVNPPDKLAACGAIRSSFVNNFQAFWQIGSCGPLETSPRSVAVGLFGKSGAFAGTESVRTRREHKENYSFQAASVINGI